MQPFTFSHTVRTFETNTAGTFTPSSLLNLLQYGAGKHAEDLGWSVRSLHESGQTWVLQRFYVEIESLPSDGETISIVTYPSGASRSMAFRDYMVKDEKDRVLVKATSAWVILDLESRRIISVPDEVSSISTSFGPSIVEFPKPRLTPFNPEEHNGEFQRAEFRIRKHDLDLNRHVNNVRYMEWGIESVPEKVFDNLGLHSFDIVFKAECFFGDAVTSLTVPSEEGVNSYRHLLTRKSDEKQVCIMESSWR